MIRIFALVTIFAVSLFAIPANSNMDIIPTPECAPNCPTFPWST
jgi:hypothetical protein